MTLRRSPLLLPVRLWALLLIAAPFLIIVAYSFATRGPHGEVLWEGTWANYGKVFTHPHAKVAWLSFQLAFWNTFLCLAAGYPLAYFMTRIERKQWRNLLLLLVLIPFWTNFLIRTYALGNVLGDEGILNRLFLFFGLVSEPLDLIYSKKGIVIGLVSNNIPFMVLPLFVSLEKLDRRLLEAAKDLGASPYLAFAKVTWPLSLPGVVTGTILVFICSLGEFIVPDLLGGGRYLVLGTLLQQKFLVLRDWPAGCALAVVVSLILTAALLLSHSVRRNDEPAI